MGPASTPVTGPPGEEAARNIVTRVSRAPGSAASVLVCPAPGQPRLAPWWVRPVLVIVLRVLGQDPPRVLFAVDQQVIEVLAP